MFAAVLAMLLGNILKQLLSTDLNDTKPFPSEKSRFSTYEIANEKIQNKSEKMPLCYKNFTNSK